MQILIVTYLHVLQGLCASPCLAISVANSNVKPSSPQVIVSPSKPAPESAITTTVIPLAIGGLLIFIFGLVTATVFIVLGTKMAEEENYCCTRTRFQR